MNKLLTIFLLGIFMISFASAWEYADNFTNYTQTGTAEIITVVPDNSISVKTSTTSDTALWMTKPNPLKDYDISAKEIIMNISGTWIGNSGYGDVVNYGIFNSTTEEGSAMQDGLYASLSGSVQANRPNSITMMLVNGGSSDNICSFGSGVSGVGVLGANEPFWISIKINATHLISCSIWGWNNHTSLYNITSPVAYDFSEIKDLRYSGLFTHDNQYSGRYAYINYSEFDILTPPTIQINSGNGTQNYGLLSVNHTINTTITDTNLDDCWYNYNNTNTIFSCSSGVNTFNFTLKENLYNLTVYANDTDGNEGNQFIDWNYKILEVNRIHNTTSYETAYETYSINITANSSLTGVTLDYNGTDYTATKSGSIWSYSRDLPLTTLGNNSIDWKFTYGGTINSDYTTYQNVVETIFTLCNSSYTDDFLNITFKDEANLNTMNASIPTSTFIYYLGSGTVTKTYNYINNTDNNNYLFCATPSRTLHVDPYVQYKRVSDYPQRVWDAVVQDYTSTLTTQILYLLESADGIYVTLQVINSANQLLSGVDITATREINNVDTTVASGTTGASGTVTFWLNPDFSHDFLFSKIGYTDYETSFMPTQTSYTITLGGAAETENSTIQGIIYSIIPTNSYLENDTSYTFGITLTSSYWDVSDYGFNLRLSNGTNIVGDNTGIEGTALTKIYDVNNQSIIYLDYYWVINGVYTNDTIYWIIHNTENTEWSIAVFFTDLNLYLDSGIYGLDDFGRNLIIFLILFLSVGIMSYKYGATSPLAVSSLIFGIIFFFDIVVGLIPDIGTIKHLPTFLAALILTLSIFSEVHQ